MVKEKVGLKSGGYVYYLFIIIIDYVKFFGGGLVER